ncbi:glycosyltransferase family 39 protein [bacterium]|nr:glycosyltransferase family 39 protein [bacterium]
MAKKTRIPVRAVRAAADIPAPFFENIGQWYESAESWIPWAVACLYTVFMAYIAFRYHTVGGLDVETDFYAELYPQAKKLVGGHFSPLNYGAKGPVYSFLLAGVYGIVRDYFKAAQVLNLLSSFLFIGVLYNLIRQVFNSLTAILVIFAVVTNFMFQNFTYQTGSDMPFLVLCVSSMYFLFRNSGTRDLVLSALFGILAFLTRYNGVFIVFGSMVFYAFEDIPVMRRMKRIGLWIGVFVVAGLPWFIPNWIATGNPVYNENYVNVMLEFYGNGSSGYGYENWEQMLPRRFTSLGDIFLYNPVYFLKKMASNAAGHFIWDMRALVEWRLGVCVMLGLAAFFFTKPDRRKLVFFSFGAVYFLILTLVFYNSRFSLYLLAFYIPVAVLPFSNTLITRFLKRFSWIPVAFLFLLTSTYAYTTTVDIIENIRYTPFFLKDMGEALAKQNIDKSAKLLARKPHAAYYAGLTPSMFPGDDVQTVDQLVTYCRKNGIEYILYSLVEVKYRPQLQELLDISKVHPGLEAMVASQFGVVYRVIPE